MTDHSRLSTAHLPTCTLKGGLIFPTQISCQMLPAQAMASSNLFNSSIEHPSLFSYELSFVTVTFKIFYFKPLHTECTGLTCFLDSKLHVVVCTYFSTFLFCICRNFSHNSPYTCSCQGNGILHRSMEFCLFFSFPPAKLLTIKT